MAAVLTVESPATTPAFNGEAAALSERILNHDYLRRFQDGDLSRQHISEVWLVQQGWLSHSFPHTFPAIKAKVPDIKAYAAIHGRLDMIIAEEGMSLTQPGSHPNQFRVMAREINPAIDFARAMPTPLRSTAEFVRMRQNGLEAHNVFYGLGVLFANEQLNSHIGEDGQRRGVMVAYQRGLERIYAGGSENLMKYTATHVEGEDGDARFLHDIAMQLQTDVILTPAVTRQFAGSFAGIESPVLDPGQQFNAGITDYLRSRIGFFDSLERHL
jgi:hypothetical protein